LTRTTPRGKPFTAKIDAVLFDRRSLSMNRGACLLPVSAQTVLHGIRALAIEHDKQPEPTGNTMVLDSQRDGLEATRCAAINALGMVAVQVRDDALGINKLVMKRGANDAPAVVADTQRVADFPSLCDNGFTAIPSDPSINEKGEVAFQGNLRRLTTTTRPDAQTPEQRRSPGVELGRRMYGELSAEMPGMLGATTVRAEAQVIRLACIYAALDMTNMISQVHLKAALAVWQYCEAPVRYIFGKHTGDPVADRIMEALEAHEELVLTAISQVVGRLALDSVVLVSLDADEAGQKAAAW